MNIDANNNKLSQPIINIYGGTVSINLQTSSQVTNSETKTKRVYSFEEINIKFEWLTSKFQELSGRYASSVSPFGEYVKEKNIELTTDEKLEIEIITDLIQNKYKKILGLQSLFSKDKDTQRLVGIIVLTDKYLKQFKIDIENYCNLLARIMESKQLTEEEQLAKELSELGHSEEDVYREFEELGAQLFTEEELMQMGTQVNDKKAHIEEKGVEAKEDVEETVTAKSWSIYNYVVEPYMVQPIATGVSQLSNLFYNKSNGS